MRHAALAIILSVTSGAALAGPDATANRFLNDSPSMMDFGAVRLESFLQSFDSLDEVSVSYNWNRNRVIIHRLKLVDHDDQRDLEDECRTWMQEVRSKASVFDGRILFGNREYSQFAEYFGHVGYRRTISGETEQEALAALDQMIVLETQYGRYGESRFEAELEMTCTGDLIATGFSVTRE